MPIDERDPVIINLRAQEKTCRDQAASYQAKAQDARTKAGEHERAAAEALVSADKFRDAIESLGA